MAQTPEEKAAAKAAKDAEKAAAKAAKDAEKAAAKAAHTSAQVLNKDGAHIRTYSLADHGEAFEDNANEFSAHTPGSSVVLS